MNHFNYRFEHNCKQRIVVRCQATKCPFYTCVRGGKNINVMYLKDYNGHHKHSVREMCQMGVWGRRHVRAEPFAHLIDGKVWLCLELAHLIDGKVWLCLDYSRRDIMLDLELELGIQLTYMQSWRGGVCADNGPWSARRSLQIIIVDVCRHCQSKPRISGVL